MLRNNTEINSRFKYLFWKQIENPHDLRFCQSNFWSNPLGLTPRKSGTFLKIDPTN